jgi:hypothetical protein
VSLSLLQQNINSLDQSRQTDTAICLRRCSFRRSFPRRFLKMRAFSSLGMSLAAGTLLTPCLLTTRAAGGVATLVFRHCFRRSLRSLVKMRTHCSRPGISPAGGTHATGGTQGLVFRHCQYSVVPTMIIQIFVKASIQIRCMWHME